MSVAIASGKKAREDCMQETHQSPSLSIYGHFYYLKV